MLTEKDYCDYDTCVTLKELGFSEPTLAYYHGFLPSKPLLYLIIDEDCMPEDGVNVFDLLSNSNKYKDSKNIDAPTLWEAQKWLREEKGIHIAPKIYLYHDINLDEQTSWECTIYVEWSAIYTIGKSLTYEDALLLGIKEAIKLLKNNQHECN